MSTTATRMRELLGLCDQDDGVPCECEFFVPDGPTYDSLETVWPERPEYGGLVVACAGERMDPELRDEIASGRHEAPVVLEMLRTKGVRFS